MDVGSLCLQHIYQVSYTKFWQGGESQYNRSGSCSIMLLTIISPLSNTISDLTSFLCSCHQIFYGCWTMVPLMYMPSFTDIFWQGAKLGICRLEYCITFCLSVIQQFLTNISILDLTIRKHNHNIKSWNSFFICPWHPGIKMSPIFTVKFLENVVNDMSLDM